MSDKTLTEMQDLFFKKINEKNSWGKNEVMMAWKDCLIELLMKKVQAPTNPEG